MVAWVNPCRQGRIYGRNLTQVPLYQRIAQPATRIESDVTSGLFEKGLTELCLALGLLPPLPSAAGAPHSLPAARPASGVIWQRNL